MLPPPIHRKPLSARPKSDATVAAKSRATIPRSPASLDLQRHSSHQSEQQESPPRASFMGLPAELRLKIYEFLFAPADPPPASPCAIPCADDGKVALLPHCCTLPHKMYTSWPGFEYGNYMRDHRIHCSCTAIRGVQILRLNKTIFAEAMPVLYNNSELRVFLPERDPPRHVRGNLSHIETYLPKYARDHVKQIVFTTSSHLTVAKVSNSARRATDRLERHWNRVWELFPSVQKARLHFDVNAECCPDSFAYEQFAGLVHGRELRSVKVEFSKCKYESRTAMLYETVDFVRELLVSNLRAETEWLGRNIDISEADIRVIQVEEGAGGQLAE